MVSGLDSVGEEAMRIPLDYAGGSRVLTSEQAQAVLVPDSYRLRREIPPKFMEHLTQVMVANGWTDTDYALRRLAFNVICQDRDVFPQAGHVVRLTQDWSIAKNGQIGVISGMLNQDLDNIQVTFSPSAFRGPSHPYSTWEFNRWVCSVSGGPGTICLNPNRLVRAPEGMVQQRFWMWGDGGPGPGRGIDYLLHVPLWEWDGTSGEDK